MTDEQTKTCTKCGETKPLGEFYRMRRGAFGVASVCRLCAASRNRAWRAENAAAVAAKVSEWRSENADTNRAQSKVRSARWRKLNPDKDRASHSDSERRRRANPKVRLEQAMYFGVRRGLVAGSKASRSTFDLLGYAVDDLRQHLHTKFVNGMSWENYGPLWHVDHIIPLAAFDYSTPDCPGFKAAWALSNLQPLWAPDNVSKGARLDHPSQAAALAAA